MLLIQQNQIYYSFNTNNFNNFNSVYVNIYEQHVRAKPNTSTDKPTYDKTPLMEQNAVQSKLLSFILMWISWQKKMDHQITVYLFYTTSHKTVL